MFNRQITLSVPQRQTATKRASWSRMVFLVSTLASVSLVAAPSSRKVTIGNDGKLEGVASGYAWVAPSKGASITSPNPCNPSGCFKNTGGQLCTKGKIAALVCSGQGSAQYKCNWEENWGMVLGFNTMNPPGPWGSVAPRSLAVQYNSVAQGGSSGHFRLTAHIAGDPYAKQYCVDNYTPGAAVLARDMKSQCWFGAGDVLPNFNQVDTVGLMRVSENVSIDFDFCVTGVSTE
jgi:hypothetical protein